MSKETESPIPEKGKEKKPEEKNPENPVSLSLLDENGLVRLGSKNKVNNYPAEILRGIQRLILEGRGASVCLNYLKANYKGYLVPPSISTMHLYVEEVRPKVQEVNESDSVRK